MLRAVAAIALLVPGAARAIETMRIHMGQEPASVRVSGGLLSMGPDIEEGAFEPVEGASAVVSIAGGRLFVNGAAVETARVRFRSRQGVDSAITVGTHSVRGEVVVQLDRGALQLINVLPLEDYLVGVLGSEMPKSFPSEALQAQAVAARTYALHKKLQAYSAPYHLGSSVLSQVYGGLRAEDPHTRAAVEATRGLILTFELAPIEAYFHSSCGGRTESGWDALSRDLPYLVSVDCPCAQLATSRWAIKLKRRELERVIGATARSASRVSVARSATGRVQRLAFSPGRWVDGVSFRERMGYTRVKSLAFEVQPDGDGYALTGRGFGHGAGLCQWGAKVLAEDGWDFRRILAHYYPGTDLQILY